MKKYFKLLVTLCVIAFMLAFTVAAATDFTGYTKISTADELLALMNSKNAVTGKYYLANDIDLTGKTQSPIGEPDGKSFGTTASPAIFDGNGHTVKGVNISGSAHIGFFGVIDNAEIRNLTIEGTIKASGSNVGGLVAYAKTKAVIENCTNNCSVTASGTGANVGGILGNTEGSSMVNLKLSNCINDGDIVAYRVVGGIVGHVQRAKNSTVLIEKCTNNGSVSATCTGTSSSEYTKVGGILGASNLGSTSATVTSFKITKCINGGEVKGYFFIGGILGELVGTDKTNANVYDKAKFHITECLNSGNVISTRSGSSGGARCGGIIGYGVDIGNITDCLNIGTVSAKRVQVGGLFGYADSFFGAKNNLNRGQVLLNGVAETTSDYVNSIGGYMPGRPYGVNYYMGTKQGKDWEHSSTKAKTTQYNESLFANLNESGNWTNAELPMLVEYAILACEHENVNFTKSGNSIVFTCALCDKAVYTDTAAITRVYVDYENGVPAAVGKDVGTASAPFKSIEEAFKYVAIAAEIKNTDAKITISGKAVLKDTFETPKTDRTIIVTGGNFHYGGELIANRHLNLGGPIVFENLTFTSAATEARINAQNNKLVMGEGIVMANASASAKTNSELPFAVNNVKMFVSGGFYHSIPDTMNTDISIRSGEYYVVSGWNATNSKDATQGTAKITVGKTNANDTLKICDLVAFSTVAQTRLTADSTVTVIIDGDVDIGRLMMSEREKTTNTVAANYITHLVIRGNISASYRNAYKAPYGFDVTGGSHTDDSLGYHTFFIYTDGRVDGAVLAEHAFFGGNGYIADDTLTTGGYKPVSDGGDVTMTQHTYMEYCATYMGGHADGNDADTLCDECGADTACDHANAVLVVVSESTCTVNGYEYTFCHDCGLIVSERELPLDFAKHNYAWEAVDGGYRYVCLLNEEHIHSTYNKRINEFYVSGKGKADGGFSADYPSNDFDTVMKLAAASSEPTTVYIIGSIALIDNDSTEHAVYIEPEHANTITIRGYKDASGILEMNMHSARLEYVLSGNTTFEQIEFNTGISTNSFYISARHNHLVMGDRITSSFGRNTSTTSNSGKLIVIGGCDNSIDSSKCDKTDTHITIESGTYYMVIGGSSIKGCGLINGTINIDVLGDIVVGGVVTNQNGFVDRQFILGCHSADAGDISMVIDGNITCTNAFCIGSYGIKTENEQSSCRTVGDISIVIKSGYILDYSFSGRSDRTYIYDDEFAKVYDPTAGALETADLVVFPLGNSHSHAIRGGVMKTVDSLNIYYNTSNDSAVQLANRFRFTLGGSDNFYMNVLPEKTCTSASGRHTPSNDGEIVLESTCRGEGSIKHICAVCGLNYTESIARMAHIYGSETQVSEANCISPAIYTKICTNEGCGFRSYSSSGEATNIHSFENGICKFCNFNKQTICAHENLGDIEEYVSGCGVGTKQICLDCEKEFISVESADHNYGKFTVTVEPTESTPGVKSRICRRCGKVDTALLYAEGSVSASEAVATNADGSLSDVDVNLLKLSSVEKVALNALLQATSYGSEVKVSYSASDAGTDITYSIPLPAEYAAMRNLKVVVKDEDGKLHTIDFKIEKGYIVFTF